MKLIRRNKLQQLDNKAKEAQEQLNKYGYVNGLHMPFNASGIGVDLNVNGYDGQSDAAYYTGLVLGAECKALHNGDDSAAARIETIVLTLHKMQEVHGKGLITRNIQPDNDGPNDWVLTGGYRWQGFLSWDQIVSVMWGYYNCHSIWDKLTDNSKSIILKDVTAIAEHFNKYNGFKGHQTNQSGSPSHISFQWKHVMRLNPFTKKKWNPKENNREWYWKLEDWFNWYGVNMINGLVFIPLGWLGIYPKKSHILYSAMIYQVAYTVTGDSKWKTARTMKTNKWKQQLTDMFTKPEPMDRWFGKLFSRTMFKIKNLTFKVPDDIIFSGNHVKSGISNTLEMLALHVLAKEEKLIVSYIENVLYLNCIKRKFNQVRYTDHPFFLALYEDATVQSFLLDDRFKNGMELFRGPRTAYNGLADTSPKKKYMSYLGDVKMFSVDPVPMDKRDYHSAWSQSGVFKHAPQASGNYSQFSGYGSFLWSYYFGKQKRIL